MKQLGDSAKAGAGDGEGVGVPAASHSDVKALTALHCGGTSRQAPELLRAVTSVPGRWWGVHAKHP